MLCIIQQWIQKEGHMEKVSSNFVLINMEATVKRQILMKAQHFTIVIMVMRLIKVIGYLKHSDEMCREQVFSL